MSLIEDSVCEKIQKRAEFGLKKYGVTLERPDLTELEWLVHAQEEAMDLANYLEVLIQEKQSKQHDELVILETDIQLVFRPLFGTYEATYLNTGESAYSDLHISDHEEKKQSAIRNLGNMIRQRIASEKKIEVEKPLGQRTKSFNNTGSGA